MKFENSMKWIIAFVVVYLMAVAYVMMIDGKDLVAAFKIHEKRLLQVKEKIEKDMDVIRNHVHERNERNKAIFPGEAASLLEELNTRIK